MRSASRSLSEYHQSNGNPRSFEIAANFAVVRVREGEVKGSEILSRKSG